MIPPDVDVARSWTRFSTRTPMMWPALCFAAGIVMSEYLHYRTAWIWAVLLCIFLFLTVRLHNRPGSSITILAAFLFGGALDAGLRHNPIPEVTVDRPLSMTGRVTDVKENDKAVNIIVDTDSFSVALSMARDESVEIPVQGDKIEFTAILRPLRLTKDVDEEIIYDSRFASRGVGYKAYISDPNSVNIRSRGNGLLYRAAEVGYAVRLAIDRSPLDHGCKDFLKAVLTGDNTAIGIENREMFSSSGLAHLLALSGTHVGIIALIANIALFPLALMGYKKMRVITLILLLWSFALITGLSPSVVRAVVMTSIFMIARLIQRQSSGFNSLMTAAFLILAVSPGQIADIGFQLSFAAVAAILVFSTTFDLSSWRSHRVLRSICTFFGISIAANLGCGIVAAYHFHYFPIYFLASNAVASLLLPLYLGAGIVYVVPLSAGWSLPLLPNILDGFYQLIRLTVETIGEAPGATVDGIYFSAWFFIPYLVFLTAVKLIEISRHRVYRKIYFTFCLLALSSCATIMASEMTRQYPDEWIITRSESKSTEIIVREGSEMKLITTAPAHRRDERLEAVKSRYAEYAGRRGVTTFRLGNPSDGCLSIGIDTLFIVSASTRRAGTMFPRHCNYLIYGADSHMSFNSILCLTPADTIVALRETNPLEYPETLTVPLIGHSATSQPWRKPIRH